MAEFTKTAKVIGRMCKSVCDCSECPIGKAKDGLGLLCLPFVCRYPEKTEELVMKWAEAHPVMTNGKKFEKVFGFTPYMKFRSYEDMRQWVESEYEGND